MRRRHAKVIVSIALGHPDDATTRVYLVQPLYVAGRSLTEAAERRSLVDILVAIEEDTGVATGYRVADLCEEWGEDARRPAVRQS